METTGIIGDYIAPWHSARTLDPYLSGFLYIPIRGTQKLTFSRGAKFHGFRL